MKTKRVLGRTYPADIQGAIGKLGLRIDALMPLSVSAALVEGKDVPRSVSALNARLVNEVILVAAQVTDDEARVRLAAIEKDVDSLEKKIRFQAPIPTQGDVRVLSNDQAGILISNWNRAFGIYDELTKRLGRLRAAAVATQAYADIVLSLQMLDADVLWTKDAFEQLAELSEGRDDVEVETGTFTRLSNWISESLVANGKLKRLEGAYESLPAKVIPSVSAQSPWISIVGVTAGLGGIGVILWLSTAKD